MSRRIMGLDVGDKWIGVALSDELGILATAKPPLRRTAMGNDVAALALMAKEWNVSEIVVGLPLNMNASVGPQAERTMALVARLRKVTVCRVTTWDERLTTRQAERLLVEQDVRREKRKKLVDGVAAALILESYLNSKAHSRREETEMSDNDKDLIGSMGEDDDEIITLTDEEGNEHEFVVVDVIEVESQEYAILLPIDTEDEEEAEAVILRLEKDADGDDILVDIEAEDEWEKVAQAYEDLLEDESGDE